MPSSSIIPKSPKKRATTVTPPLAEQAYLAIKRMILTGELIAGEQINVNSLSEQLSLGRSPVHMAIHKLDREGLVDILPRKGILVRSETLESFFELLNARLLIEPYLTEQAVDNITPEQIDKLEELITKGWEHHHNNDRLASMKIDRLFHQIVYESSGNKILADFASQLLDRSMILWFRSPASQVEQPNVAELELLFETIKKKDKASAVEFMHKHVSSIRNRYMSI